MHRYIIEREIPAAGSMSREELRGAAAKSNAVLAKLGPDVQWVQSLVANDRLFCVYLAKDESLVRKHAALSGFPADRIVEVPRTIDTMTAEAA